MNTLIDPTDVASWTRIKEAQERGYQGLDDQGVLATFYDRPVYQKHRSEIEGAPRYETVVFVKIVAPSDRKNAVDRKATDEDKARFRSAWQRYQDRSHEGDIGTPLSEMTWITPAQLAVCRHVGIVAVEQLANAGEAMLSQIGMGARALQQKALQALQGDDMAIQGLRRENAELKQHLAEMQRRMEALERMPARSMSESEPEPEPEAQTAAEKIREKRIAALAKARAAKQAKRSE